MSHNLVDTLLGVTRRWPEKIAVDAQGARITFQELMDLANVLAGFLKSNQLARGDRIGIALTQGDDVLIAMLAAWYLGATAVQATGKVFVNELAGSSR